MPHEMKEFAKKVSSTPLEKNKTHTIGFVKNITMSDSVYLFIWNRMDRAYLRLVYSCNCRQNRIQSSPKAGTRLYITCLFATIVGKVSNLQRFISLKIGAMLFWMNTAISITIITSTDIIIQLKIHLCF